MRFSATTSLLSLAAVAVAQQTDSTLVGYLSASSGVYTESRICDFGFTQSTSSGFARCCPTSGACTFATGCSGNVLIGPSTTFDCATLPSLKCNTAVLVSTAGASSGASYIDCWQATIASDPFTFVQNIGSGTFVLPSATTSAGSPSTTGGSSPSPGSSNASPAASTTGGSSIGAVVPTSTPNKAAAAGAEVGTTAPILLPPVVDVPTSTPNKAAAAGADSGLSNGGVIAAALALAQAIL